MTERLSPSQWRDLATFWAYWVGDAKVAGYMMDHAGHMEGASAGEDKPAPAADDLVQAALDARFSIEQLEEDKTALQARVAEAEAALAACRAKTIEECIKYVESCDSGDSAASIASGLRALAKEAKT